MEIWAQDGMKAELGEQLDGTQGQESTLFPISEASSQHSCSEQSLRIVMRAGEASVCICVGVGVQLCGSGTFH